MYDATKLPGISTEQMVSASGGKVVSLSAVSTGEPITLEEAKKQCRVELPDDDDFIASLIPVARQMAEGRLNRTIVQRQLEARFDGWSARLILPKPPLVSVDEISYIDEFGATAYLSSNSYVVSNSSEPGRISLAYGASWPVSRAQSGAIVVRYTAGYPEGQVPAPIIQWMKLVIASLYMQRENIVVGVSVDMIPEQFNSWLLQPYMVYE